MISERGAERAMNEQKYVKISVVVDDGETTSIQTFYRVRDVTDDLRYADANLYGPMLYDLTFKAELDHGKACVTTLESFKNDDGELYVRKGGIIRKLGS